MPLPLPRKVLLQTLQALDDYDHDTGRAPSVQELAGNMGLSRTTVHHRLEVLRRYGLVTWVDGQARTLVLTLEGEQVLEQGQAWVAIDPQPKPKPRGKPRVTQEARP